jgi:hypothetical protein
LYLSLRAMPCRCAYAREWSRATAGAPLERKLESVCSRCAALREYEAKFSEAA